MTTTRSTILPACLAFSLILFFSACEGAASTTSRTNAADTTAEGTATTAEATATTSAPTLLRPETATRSSYPPGKYWWDPAAPVWIHNPTDTTVGVEITLAVSPPGEDEPTPVPAVVAGFDGTYRQLPVGADGVRTEVWVVDIESTMITITVSAQPVVTDAELSEGHAIVESLRTEPWESRAGFRMIFTLPPGWDSG